MNSVMCTVRPVLASLSLDKLLLRNLCLDIPNLNLSIYYKSKKIKKLSFSLTSKIHSLHSFKYVSIKLAVPAITGNLCIIP